MYEGFVLYRWQGQDSSDKSVQCEIPEEVVSVVPCKEVALRRAVPQTEISHLNRQYGHLCPLFNNDKKWRRHYWTKINVQNGFVKEQREFVERNEESITPWLWEEEMVRGKQSNIARGTTDPEIDTMTWTIYDNNMAPLAYVANLTTRWRHLD